MKDLKYPIGKFIKPETINDTTIRQWISDIQQFPSSLEALVTPLSIEQVNWRYRPGGWMIKQVVHHCADSHINSLIRFKLALTEDAPTIRPYFEDRWAELIDSLDDNLNDSLMLIKGLHSKWVTLLNSLSEQDLDKTFIHPEHGKSFTLRENIGIYAWHCNHHLAHIRQALEHRGEF